MPDGHTIIVMAGHIDESVNLMSIIEDRDIMIADLRDKVLRLTADAEKWQRQLISDDRKVKAVDEEFDDAVISLLGRSL